MDDPLDFLSDNSLDNDNFFENLTASVKPRVKAKSKLDDLFGIKEEKEANHGGAVTTRRASKAGVTSTPLITKQRPTQSHDNGDRDGDDDDLGFDPRKPKAGGNKLNLFDDLLTSVEAKRPATASLTTRTAVSRQSTADTATDNSNYPQPSAPHTRPKTSAGRRSSGNADPLGLFGGKDKESNISSSVLSTPKAKKRNTADWLGLGLTELPAKEVDERGGASSPREPKTNLEPKVDILSINHPNVPNEPAHLATSHVTPPPSAFANVSTASNILLLNTMSAEASNALVALQQQESQLSVATQMKAQEQALHDMQRRQEALLLQQEQQFQVLVQQQMQRQQQMEEQIRLQQQRINAHIQLLMTQPAAGAIPTTTTMTTTTNHEEQAEEQQWDEPTRKQQQLVAAHEAAMDKVQMDADVKRLELEKLRLEELVESLTTNYERQIELTEKSYKKQLLLLDEQQAAVEARLKAELEEQQRHYRDKLEGVQSERDQLKKDFDSELAALRQDHDDTVHRLRKSQEDDLELLRLEHRRMLESVRQAKMLEFAAVQENGSYLDTLKAATNNLEGLSGDLQGLRDELQTRIETINREKEKKLAMREQKLEDAERRLKINEETADEEKRRLMELVSTLELQLGKLSKDAAEENWQLRQRMTTVDAEKAAFEREKEFEREQLKRDEKRLAELKDSQLAETQRLMADLRAERARLAAQRAAVEMERQLHPPDEAGEQQRVEVEAALKVAQDATRQADAERARHQKAQRLLEQQKRELVDRENFIHAKESELEQEVCSFRLAERKSQEAQQRAKVVEADYERKLQLLQRRKRELADKEAALSQERMLVSKERIQLHNLKVKLSERKCTLCQMAERSEEITQLLHRSDTADCPPIDTATTGDGTAHRQPPFRSLMPGAGNAVDRLLDENIAESYRKMKESGNLANFWTESVLDDDSKELALCNLDTRPTFE